MPIYEMYCSQCDSIGEVICTHEESKNLACPNGHAPLMRLPSLTIMKPDRYWSGQVVPGYGYFTSESDLKKKMKAKGHVVVGDRTDREGMEKLAESGVRSRTERIDRDRRKWIEKTFGPSGLALPDRRDPVN